MGITFEITGLNLEKLISLAAGKGVVIRGVRRVDVRCARARVSRKDAQSFCALCDQYGWDCRVVRRSAPLRLMAFIRKRPMLLVSVMLFFMLTALSSKLIWRIQIKNAGKNIGEIRVYLREAGVGPCTWKTAVRLGELREALILRLPDLAYVSAKYAGSTLMIDCQPALDAEHALMEETSRDIIALQDGVVTHIAAYSGTPMVQAGQAVRKGDVLIKGEERGEKESLRPVYAQGEVLARVWARGDARVSIVQRRTVETGLVRRRVTLCSPWHRRVVSDTKPFEEQDVDLAVQPIVGLYLPFWREIETMAEIRVIDEQRDQAAAASMAQAAAWQKAKFECPSGAEILDKTVDYSMIDNEFVCATVVLEYERSIAARRDEAQGRRN